MKGHGGLTYLKYLSIHVLLSHKEETAFCIVEGEIITF